MTLYKNIKSIRRGTALFLSCLIFWQNIIPNTIYAKSTDNEERYSLTEEEILASVREALKKNKTQNKDKFEFSGDYIEDYEDLFGLYDDSELYKLNFTDNNTIASGSSIKKEKITAYLKLDENEDTPNESKIIFVAQNTAKKSKKVTFNLMGQDVYVSVPSKKYISEALDEDDVETASDIRHTATMSEVIASPSGLDSIITSDDLSLDVDFYEPVLLNEKATVAFSIPADDFVEKASKTEYTYETDSAVITAFADKDAFDEDVTLEVRELDEDEEESISELLHEENKLFAGKKTFDIHFLNDDGDEIEPNSEVEVTIKLKDNVVPENADPDSFTIYHLSDDNAQNGASEFSLCVSKDVNDKVNNTTNVLFDEIPARTIKTENSTITRFTTDSFSFYVLSYNGYNQIWAYLYDEEGNPLPGEELHGWVGDNNKFNPTDFCASWEGGWGSSASQNKWISIQALTDVFGSRTSGYNYIDAYTDKDMKSPFNWIYFAKGAGYSGTWWVSTSEDKPSQAPSENDDTSRKIEAEPDDDGEMKMRLYIKFKNDITISELDDEVEENGYFLAKVPEDIPEYATLNYKWYRSDDGETYEEIVKKKAANKSYNIEVDTMGSKLYPARDLAEDISIRRWYKAELYVNGKLYKTYSPRQVQDYPSIMNGSFESPDTYYVNDNSGYLYPNGTNGLYWKTSASDKQIEIIRAGSVAGSAYGCAEAADGVQWVELNAEAKGALYQHVLVQPGSTLYWNFSHRGRSWYENMYMVIAPRNKVNSDSSTDELITLAENILNGASGYTEDDGYFAKSVTDGTSSWATYDGSYTVPEGVWLLSFFFISNSGSTAGNLIDNVSFSTSVPEPEAGCANITAKETVSGLLSDDMSKLSMHVWLESESGNISTDKNGEKAEKIVAIGEMTEDKGAYTKIINFPNMPDDTKYTIKKELIFDGDMSVPDAYTKTEEKYYVYRNGVLEETDDGETASFMAYDEKRDKIIAEFEDSFEIEFVPITVNKKLTGNAIDTDKEFKFTVSGTLKNGKEITDEISDGDREFILKGAEEKVIYVPYGSTVTIAEDDYTDDKYITYYEIIPGDVTKGRKATIPNVITDKEVTFTNKAVEFTVSIRKTNENGNRLKDAGLSLYRNGKQVDTTITNETMDWTVTVVPGDYKLVENSAPTGYDIAKPIIFNVDEAGVVTSNMENAVSVTDATSYIVTMVDKLLPGTLTIENTINEKYEPFGTASFMYEIVNDDNTYKKVVMLTMNDLTENTSVNLPVGTYTIRQIPVSRYVPETEEMNINIVSQTTTTSFKNTITQYEMFSHVTGVINKIKEKIT